MWECLVFLGTIESSNSNKKTKLGKPKANLKNANI
jgi:hypothetical protein